MAMTGGIGYEVDQLTELGVPELMRRQSVDPQLKYALALQQATKLVEAAARERDMSQQMPMPANVVGQMETSLAKRLAPGVQMQGQRSQRMQNRAAMGLPGQAAPNLARMAGGGIVGYQEGGDVEGKSTQAPMMGDENQRRAPYLDPALEKFLIELEALNAQKDAAFPQEKDLFEQKIQDLIDTTSPRVKRLASDSAFGLPKKSGMAMGGAIKGYASGGKIKAYLASVGRDIADFTEAQLDAIGQMLDSQVARGQNDTLRQVGRGAMGVLRDRLPATTSMSQADIDAREAGIEQRRGGLGALLSPDESGPSVTEQLEAAERKISAEGRGQSTGRNVSPGRAAAARRRELRAQMPDQETRPSLYERTKDYMPDFGAIAGMDIGEFARGSGLVDAARAVDESGFFSGLEDALANIKTEVPEDAPAGYRAGVRTRDVLSAPYDILSGFLQPTRGDWTTTGDIVEGAEEFGRGLIGEQPSTTTPTTTATPTPAPLTEAEKFRRDAPAGLVSAIDAAEGERAAFRTMFPNAPELTAQERAAERARIARGGGDRSTRRGAGLAGLLDKIGGTQGLLNVAETLGRGAGASKGFETAKIVEESARARAAQEARQDQLDKLREQLEVEREKIGATKATAEVAAEARLNQEQMRQLSDFLTSDAYTTAQLQKAKELGVAVSDPRVTQALEPMVRDFINKVRGGVGGMGGLDTQPGLAEAASEAAAYLAETE